MTMLSSYNNNIWPNVIDTLSNGVLQNVPYNTVPYNTFFKFHTSCLYSGSRSSATCQAILSSVILAQYERKKFPGEVGDILEGPEYKVHLECPVQH